MHPESTPSAEYRPLPVDATHALSPLEELAFLALAPLVVFLVAAAVATIVLALVRPGFAFGSDEAAWPTASASGVHAAGAANTKG